MPDFIPLPCQRTSLFHPLNPSQPKEYHHPMTTATRIHSAFFRSPSTAPGQGWAGSIFSFENHGNFLRA